MQRARVIWIKLRLAEAFPASYAEINASPSVLDNYITPSSRRKYTATYRRAVNGRSSAAGESSACLLLALSTNRGGMALTPDLLGPALGDSDGDGLKEIIDGWQQPVQFNRFYWNDAAFQTSTTRQTRFADPLDPSGTLTRTPWYGSPNRVTFETMFHPIAPPTGSAWASSRTANFVAPVIYSGGPDNNAATTGDNVFSYSLKGTD